MTRAQARVWQGGAGGSSWGGGKQALSSSRLGPRGLSRCSWWQLASAHAPPAPSPPPPAARIHGAELQLGTALAHGGEGRHVPSCPLPSRIGKASASLLPLLLSHLCRANRRRAFRNGDQCPDERVDLTSPKVSCKPAENFQLVQNSLTIFLLFPRMGKRAANHTNSWWTLWQPVLRHTELQCHRHGTAPVRCHPPNPALLRAGGKVTSENPFTGWRAQAAASRGKQGEMTPFLSHLLPAQTPCVSRVLRCPAAMSPPCRAGLGHGVACLRGSRTAALPARASSRCVAFQ